MLIISQKIEVRKIGFNPYQIFVLYVNKTRILS